MCVSCLRTKVDISEGIPKQSVLYFCKGCDRYLVPPDKWVVATLESKELLTLCLKKLKGLNAVRLVDAGFVWTEPHSKRIKLKLTIQKEVNGGAVLQQIFVVDFIVNGQFCEDCQRVEAKDYWTALVQVRQKTTHRKTFFYLEQLILKYKAHEKTVSIRTRHGGLDFFYASEGPARKMVDFVTSVIPCKVEKSKTLISHDTHSNTYHYKYTFSLDIVPVCKDDIVCLPPKLAHSLGGMKQICVVQRVNSEVHLIEPSTAQFVAINGPQYWRYPFTPLCHPKAMAEYTVMDVNILAYEDQQHFSGQGRTSRKHAVADVWVVKSEELGLTDATIHTRSHLGLFLHPGDAVLGFNVEASNVNNTHFEAMNKDQLSDVLIIKKVFPDRAARRRRRRWRLKHMDMEEEGNTDKNTDDNNRDYEEFLDDLEEDPLTREKINIYKDTAKMSSAVLTDGEDEEDTPHITLEEMLDDLQIEEPMQE